MKYYNEEINEGSILEPEVEYPKKHYKLHSDLPFLRERIETKKYCKVVCNLYDKNNYDAHIRTLKQTLNYGLILKKYIK